MNSSKLFMFVALIGLTSLYFFAPQNNVTDLLKGVIVGAVIAKFFLSIKHRCI